VEKLEVPLDFLYGNILTDDRKKWDRVFKSNHYIKERVDREVSARIRDNGD